MNVWALIWIRWRGDFNEISGFGRNPVSWLLFQGMNKGHGNDVNFCTAVVLGCMALAKRVKRA
jgi:hypothetical protein